MNFTQSLQNFNLMMATSKFTVRTTALNKRFKVVIVKMHTWWKVTIQVLKNWHLIYSNGIIANNLASKPLNKWIFCCYKHKHEYVKQWLANTVLLWVEGCCHYQGRGTIIQQIASHSADNTQNNHSRYALHYEPYT